MMQQRTDAKLTTPLCPFTCRFDVYCDAMTRTVSLASLFGFARHCHELQVSHLSLLRLLLLLPSCPAGPFTSSI